MYVVVRFEVVSFVAVPTVEVVVAVRIRIVEVSKAEFVQRNCGGVPDVRRSVAMVIARQPVPFWIF